MREGRRQRGKGRERRKFINNQQVYSMFNAQE